MSSISMSSGEGSIRSSRRPESILCQARCRSAVMRSPLRARSALRRERGDGLMAMAIDEMIVDHAGRLHESVDDRRPDEIAAAGFQVLRDRLGLLGLRRNVADRLSRVLD